MQWQGPNIVRLLPIDPNFNPFGGLPRNPDNSEGVGIELRAIKIQGDFSLFRRRSYINYPIEGKRINSAHLHAFGDQIPAPSKGLQPVRFNLVALFPLFIVGMTIDDFQASVLFHRPENGRQVGVARGNRFQCDSSAQAFTIYQEIVYSEGFQQPASQIVPFEVIAVFDKVFVRPAVAGDIDIEERFDGFPVILEGLSRKFLSARPFVPEPAAADFIQRDSSRGIDRLQKPQVTAQQRRRIIRQGIHRPKFFHKDKNSFRQNSAEASIYFFFFVRCTIFFISIKWFFSADSRANCLLHFI